MTYYRHEQKAWWLILVLLLLLAPVFLVYSQHGGTGRFPLWIFLLIVSVDVFLALMFWKLTIEVSEQHIRVFFGIGWIRKTIPLSEVISCEPSQHKWYWGWGIRYTGDGWMWNIQGLNGVVLHLKQGDVFRLGSDEPQRLQEAIVSRLENP